MTRPRSEELLAAYASGATLTDEERTAVEALLDQSPAARREVEAIGTLLGDLRAAAPEPPPASEAVVRAVRIACATAVPWPVRARTWLRRRWPIVVPVALAAGAAVVIAIQLAGRGPTGPAPEPPPVTATPDRATPPVPVVPGAPAADELWLDGESTDLGELDDDATDELDRELDDELAALGDATDDDGEAFDGLLPDDGLTWVDELDDAEADQLDRWLAEHPS